MILVERLTTAPEATEPVTADAVMAYGRITDTAERPVVEALIAAAREETERLTGRILVLGTFALVMEDGAGLSRAQFPIAPIVSVDSIAWETPDLPPVIPPAMGRAAAGLLGSVQWADPTIVPLIAWQTVFMGAPRNGAAPAVQTTAAQAGAPLLLRLKVTAGYATAAAVPEGIRHFVTTLALLRYAHRDDPAALERAQAFAASGVSSFGVIQA